MKLTDVNVLVAEANWAWPEAIKSIFAPRGVNWMVAADAAGAMDIISSNPVHTAIVDIDSQRACGLSIMRVIHGYYPCLPCIVVSDSSHRRQLGMALELDVFGVVAKPVDMTILKDELNRLFVKKYNSDVFG